MDMTVMSLLLVFQAAVWGIKANYFLSQRRKENKKKTKRKQKEKIIGFCQQGH